MKEQRVDACVENPKVTRERSRASDVGFSRRGVRGCGEVAVLRAAAGLSLDELFSMSPASSPNARRSQRSANPKQSGAKGGSPESGSPDQQSPGQGSAEQTSPDKGSPTCNLAREVLDV